MCSCMKTINIFSIYVSKEQFEGELSLLLISNNEKQHYVLNKDFNKMMFKQTKHKEKKHFCM